MDGKTPVFAGTGLGPRNPQGFLANNAELRGLHTMLVLEGKAVTENEFLGYQNDMPYSLQQKGGVPNGFRLNHSQLTHTAGVASNTIQYSLTSADIQSMFQLHPGLRAKYTSLVPLTMSENEFWGDVIRSNHFNRHPEAKLVETSLGDLRATAVAPLAMKQKIDILVDLTGDERVLPEGFGCSIPEAPLNVLSPYPIFRYSNDLRWKMSTPILQ